MFDQVYEFIGFLLEGQYYAKIIKDMSSYYRILPESLEASTDNLLDFLMIDPQAGDSSDFWRFILPNYGDLCKA
jgi:hypothetical protein